MSTPKADPIQRHTRSSTRKSSIPSTKQTVSASSSPVLRGKKRPISGGDPGDEPANKKMSEDKILDAIKAVNTSVTSMEARMRSFTTKADLDVMVEEIKEVKEKVTVNSINIEKLFDLRKTDRDGLVKKVEEIVENKFQSEERQGSSTRGPSSVQAEKERQFLLCRRSIRIWPISEVGEMDAGVRNFLKRYLKVPEVMADGVELEHFERLAQPRRSKVHKEVLVRFANSQTRDTIQSFATNLAGTKGVAGLRMEIPDHLRGLFRLFESHGAALRTKYGQVRRSIRFDVWG